MNLTASPPFFEGEPDNCSGAFLPRWKSSGPSAEVYIVLIFTAIVSLITLHFTILLNALVMVAVKTTPRLRGTKANILLACLAATDLMVGLTVQPSYITMVIFFLEVKGIKELCAFERVSGILFNIFCGVSLFHLVLVSVERYLAIKHPFYYDGHITTTRLIIASSIAWILALLPAIMDFLDISFEFLMVIFDDVIMVCTIPVIVICHIIVYIVVRRHEKQIITQQVSLEARQKFAKEKKALKTTTVIIITVFLCYSPTISISYFIEAVAVNVAVIVFFLGVALTLLNSLINPLIYAARNRQFRVAFVQLLFRRRLEQAEETEMRVFRSANAVLTTQEGPEELRIP